MSEDDRFGLLQAALGKANKRIEELEYQLSTSRPSFDGLSLENIMEAIARGTVTGDPQQIYALKVMLDRSPPAVANDPLTVEGRWALYGQDIEENRRWVLGPEAKIARAAHGEMDRQLHKWITSGEITEGQALLVRTLYVDEGDAAWESVHHADTAPQRLLEIGGKPRQNGADSLSSAPPMQTDSKLTAAGNGHAQMSAVTLYKPLYTHPRQKFKTLNGRVYEADNSGEILCDESDVDELRQRLGARDRR